MVFEKLPFELIKAHVIPFLDIQSKFFFGLVCQLYYSQVEKDLKQYSLECRKQGIRTSMENLRHTISIIVLSQSISMNKDIIDEFYRKHTCKRLSDYITIHENYMLSTNDVYSHFWPSDSEISINEFKKPLNKGESFRIRNLPIDKIEFINRNGFPENYIDKQFDEYYFHQTYKIQSTHPRMRDIILGLFLVKPLKSDLTGEPYDGLDDIDYDFDTKTLSIYPRYRNINHNDGSTIPRGGIGISNSKSRQVSSQK